MQQWMMVVALMHRTQLSTLARWWRRSPGGSSVLGRPGATDDEWLPAAAHTITCHAQAITNLGSLRQNITNRLELHRRCARAAAGAAPAVARPWLLALQKQGRR